LILLKPQTDQLYPTPTSARTAVVSQLNPADPHLPLMTRKNHPSRANLPSRSSPSIPLSQTLSVPITPNYRKLPIEYP
jgi:hypothetical protein